MKCINCDRKINELNSDGQICLSCQWMREKFGGGIRRTVTLSEQESIELERYWNRKYYANQRKYIALPKEKKLLALPTEDLIAYVEGKKDVKFPEVRRIRELK